MFEADSGRPRILVLTSTFPRRAGDTEPSFVFELCRRLLPSYDVTVLAPHAPGIRRREFLDGVEIVRFRYFLERFQYLAYQGGILANLKKRPWTAMLVPFFLAAELAAVLRILRSDEIRLIHAHWIIPQGLVAVLARVIRGQNLPLLCTSHGGDLFALRGALLARVKKMVTNRMDALTVVSRAMKRVVEPWVRANLPVRVIPMGVDLSQGFVPDNSFEREQSILFVGRLVEKKGLPHLLKAFAQVHAQHPGWVLRIVGDGPDARALKQQAECLGVEDSVRFEGPVENRLLPAYYASAGAVAFPSVVAGDGDREGFGLVAVEALGCECAVVASGLEAVLDIVRDRENALVVPPADPEALAGALNRLIEQPRLARKLGQAGREYVLQRFDWPIVADRYRALMAALMD